MCHVIGAKERYLNYVTRLPGAYVINFNDTVFSISYFIKYNTKYQNRTPQKCRHE